MSLNETHIAVCAEIAPNGGIVYIYDLKEIHKHPTGISGHFNNPFLLLDG